MPRQGPASRTYDRGYANDRGYGRPPDYGTGGGPGYRDRGYAVPRGGYGYRPYYPGHGYGYRPYYGYGYGSGYWYGGYGYGHGYRPYYYSHPYYVFRPRLSLGFGIWIGYPIAYPYYTYGYLNPTYGYPLSTFGLSAGVAYGGISFEIEPYDAAVYVDGNYVGVVNDFGPGAQPLTLSAGMHHVEIQAQGYAPIVWDVNVIPGQVIPYRGTMQPY